VNSASASARDAALRMLAWSRVWSPLVSDALRAEAWSVLDLPGAFSEVRSDYWSLFHVGSPVPRVSTLLHSALGREGAPVREDWMRAAHHLGLRWNEARLAPDQLGVACEVYACAIENDESVLITELRRRYLLPWCEAAAAALEGAPAALASLPSRLDSDLRNLPSCRLGEVA
jgi:TorA maturation chaperone TorD